MLKDSVDLIIPVYDGYDETIACIESVLGSSNTIPCRVIVINDCSPNSELSDYLQQMADRGDIELLVNEKNLGFVSTVNRGMKLHPLSDVVLVNSDTLVANNWLDRLVNWAYLDDKVGSVTPFSNNAEVCSFPTLCKSNELIDNYSVHQIDTVMSNVSVSSGYSKEEVVLPTGVGFCMYIRRSALDEVGLFDEEAFGRGYGEENDWCRRAISSGFRHLLATDTFVFHEGGVSFSNEKVERIENAMSILDKKYPDYHREVHEHIQLNPARAIRENIQLEMLASSEKTKILAITHDMGGGIQTHIDELQAFYQGRVEFILLKPFGENSVQLSYNNDNFDFSIEFVLDQHWTLLLKTLRMLKISSAHFHHLMRVPEKIWTLSQVLNIDYDVTLHDYYFINGNPTLTDGDGVYVEKPEEREVRCVEHYPIPGGMTWNQWLQKIKNFLSGASRVFSPCFATAKIYQNYFPAVDITVAYHPDAEQIISYPAVTVPQIREYEKLRIAVIGAISREKGADVLEHTACHKDPMDRLEFHLIGYAYKPLRETVVQHGAYRNENLQALIDDIKPHVIWFPAQWPETYCYVLSSAMQAGLPIVAPDIGSFPERLHGRPVSQIRKWSLQPEEWKNAFIELREWMISNVGQRHEWENCASGTASFRYKTDFISRDPQTDAGSNSVGYEDIVALLTANQSVSESISSREKLLRVLLVLRGKPVFRLFLRLVPFETQRKIKRLLSRRPIHDVLNDGG